MSWLQPCTPFVHGGLAEKCPERTHKQFYGTAMKKHAQICA